MWLNSNDEWIDWLNLGNKVSEQSEQQREEAAAALAAIRRSQKDEKKVQIYDVWLTEIIKMLLSNSVYDHVVTQLVPLLNARCPSHILVAYLLPLSDPHLTAVRAYLRMNEISIPSVPVFSTRLAYQEPLPNNIASHLNAWMDTVRGCITIDPSHTATKKINDLVNSVHEAGLVKLVAHVLAHFLYDRWVTIESRDATRVAQGIVKKMILLVQGIQIDDFFLTMPDREL